MGNATMRHDETGRTSGSGIWGLVIRFIVSALVLMVTSFFVPGFVVRGFVSALIAAAVIALADYLITRIFRFDASPFGRGISGFIVSAAIIYFAQYFVPGMAVTFWGAIIGALVIGIIDGLLPSRVL